MNAHFVFQCPAGDSIAFTQRAIVFNQDFGDNEQANAFDTFRSSRHTAGSIPSPYSYAPEPQRALADSEVLRVVGVRAGEQIAIQRQGAGWVPNSEPIGRVLRWWRCGSGGG